MVDTVIKHSYTRGVSLITAVTLLIIVAIAISVILYIFLEGSVTSNLPTYKPSTNLVCEGAYFKGDVVVRLRNYGSVTEIVDAAYLSPAGAESWSLRESNLPLRIFPNEVKTVIISAKGLEPGPYKVKIATKGGGYVVTSVNIEGVAIDDYIGPITPAFTTGSPLEPIEGWHGTYYDISGLPETVPPIEEIESLPPDHIIADRIDEEIDFTDDGYGGQPWNLPQTDRFAAIWEASVYVKYGGTYIFEILVDDGIAIDIDGSRVFTSWKLQAPTRYYVNVELTSGFHTVKIYYFENYGIARISVKINYRTYTYESIVGKYYETSGEGASPNINKIINGQYPLILEKEEEFIDYTDNPNYGGYPWPISDTDTFAVYWVIDVYIDLPGTYAVRTYNDDGVVVWVDGEEVIYDWYLHGPKWNEAQVYLSRGYHTIEIVYYENLGIARMYFELILVKSELSLTWVANVYDLSGWTDWSSSGLQQLLNALLNNEVPNVGTYQVSNIYFSDTPGIPGDQWFFVGDGGFESTDNFGVVFTTSITVNDYSYLEVSAYSDDGVRVFVNDQAVLDDWSLHPPRKSYGGIFLSPGQYVIKVAYFEHYINAVLHINIVIRPSRPVTPYPVAESNAIIIEIKDPSEYPPQFYVTVIDDRGNVVGQVAATNLMTEIKVPVHRELPFNGAIAIWVPKKS